MMDVYTFLLVCQKWSFYREIDVSIYVRVYSFPSTLSWSLHFFSALFQPQAYDIERPVQKEDREVRKIYPLFTVLQNKRNTRHHLPIKSLYLYIHIHTNEKLSQE